MREGGFSMGFLTLPIYWLGLVFFGFFLVVLLTVGPLLYGQMWTNVALHNATSAAVTQVSNANGSNEYTLANQSDALNTANKTWAVNQAINPSVASSTATFSVTSNNVTGNATMPVQPALVNNFINSISDPNTSNYSGSLQETVTSSLPSAPSSSLPPPPTSTLPTLGAGN